MMSSTNYDVMIYDEEHTPSVEANERITLSMARPRAPAIRLQGMNQTLLYNGFEVTNVGKMIHKPENANMRSQPISDEKKDPERRERRENHERVRNHPCLLARKPICTNIDESRIDRVPPSLSCRLKGRRRIIRSVSVSDHSYQRV